MTKRRWMKALGVGTAVAVAGMAAVAVGGPLTAHGSPEHLERLLNKRIDAALNDLKATDEQRGKVDALKADAVADLKAYMSAQKEARESALELWSSASPDPKTAHAMVDQRIDALRALSHKMADRVLALHATLTPEQRSKLAERIKHHHHRGPHAHDRRAGEATEKAD